MTHYLNVFSMTFIRTSAPPSFPWQLVALRLRAVHWRASSSQMLSKRGMNWASNLFHIGILGIFFGHLFGMLTPHWMYARFYPSRLNSS